MCTFLPPGGPGPPGAQKCTPAGTPKKGPFWGLSTMVIYGNGGSWGAPQGPPGGPPGTPPCTFFWVFNNSPSRDSFGPPAGPPRDPPGAPGPGQDTQSLAIGWGSGGGNTPQWWNTYPSGLSYGARWEVRKSLRYAPLEPSGLWSPMLDGVTQFAGRFASRSRYRVHSNLSELGPSSTPRAACIWLESRCVRE